MQRHPRVISPERAAQLQQEWIAVRESWAAKQDMKTIQRFVEIFYPEPPS